MATYTVCSEILTLCKQSPYYLINILYYFIQENPYKICLDENDLILNIYKVIAEDNKDLSSWINFLSYDKRNYEIISCIKKHENEKHLFVLVCAVTFEKLLISRSKQDYVRFNKLIEQMGINILEKDEVVFSFSKKKVKEKNVIKIKQSTKGDNSAVSLGNIKKD